MPDSDRVKTGVDGLDAMMGGGLPRGSVTLVRGGPGAGKTTLALQFLMAGIREGEKGLYITLEEGTKEVVRNASQYGWDLAGASAGGDLLVHALTLTRSKDYLKSDASQGNWLVGIGSSSAASGLSGDFKADALGTIVSRLVRDAGAKRLVFDSLTMFTAQFERRVDLHLETLDLIRSILNVGPTTMLTAHADPQGATIVSAEEYLSQGVINMHFLQHQGRVLQAIQVLKMRGVVHDRELRPYRISDKGIVVYPAEAVLGAL